MTNEPRTFTLPSDLGAQIGRDTLARLVHQIAGACAARLAPDLSLDDPAGTTSGGSLLGLLTYCYASGALSSRAITEIADADLTVRSFCGDAIPERDEIAGFRRAHRALIQDCMKQVYEAAWQTMMDQAAPETVPGGIAETLPRPSQTARFDQVNVLHQISERLSRAAQMDCWSRDW